MSGLTAFIIAVGGTSLIFFLVMGRVQSRSPRRSAAGDGAGDGDRYDSGGDGGNAFSWFGGDNSTSTIRAHRVTPVAGIAEGAAAATAEAEGAISATLSDRKTRV